MTINSELTRTREAVIQILKEYPNTRNNDFYLQILYLKIVEGLPLPWIDYETIRHLGGKMESIRRVRAKIQNEEGLFPPTDPKVVHKRRNKEAKMRDYFAKGGSA